MEKPSARVIRNDPKGDGRASWDDDGVAAHWIGLPFDQRGVQCRVRRIELLGTMDDLKLVTVQVAETSRSVTTQSKKVASHNGCDATSELLTTISTTSR